MNISSHKEKTIAIFNTDVDQRTRILDSQIEAGTYHRGYFFRDRIESNIPAGSKILDYGCGSGRLTRLVGECGYEMVGLDPAVELIRKAKEQDLSQLKVRFEVLEKDGDSLPENVYDAVICSSAIEFIPDPAKVLHNLYKTLKPGGSLIISFSNPYSFWKYYAKLRFKKQYEHFSVQKTSMNFIGAKKLLRFVGFKKVTLPTYFESAMDKNPILKPLNRIPVIGTLFLVRAVK